MNNTPIQGLFDIGASMSIMSKEFYNQIHQKPKLIMGSRLVSSAGGDNLQPVDECFIQMKIGKKMFRDQVIIVKNLSRPFILGVAIQRTNWLGMGYSTDGRHFITIKGKVIAQSFHSTIGEPIWKTKGRIILKPNSISVITVNTPSIPDTNILYEVYSKFKKARRNNTF